ncbi:parallel beta-helix domain-containing protein [Pontibacter toksunensis]|uniref:Parallel beta-helix domain-containing protein n=1 Tax=Pontibacter toksunensis TaxID=1332631 RepID=A0ABW6BXV7_9BACT
MQKSVKILHQARQRLTGIVASMALFSLSLLVTACEEEFFSELDWLRPDIIVTAGSSIQAAVDAAAPGDMILIKPGLYREAILVDKPNITLRGSGGVVIENPGGKEDGIRVTANGDGFELYHVTLRDFEENGVIMIRADDYVLSHVTTVNCGEYGLFPIASSHGLIEYCIASGHTDSGIYIGQCEDTEMYHNKTFENVIGLEIENCSKVVASYNQSYNNAAGVLIILLPGLRVTTSSDILFTKNKVFDNNHVNFSEPGGGFENYVPSGSGVLVVGTDNTRLEQNKVMGNNFLGIAVVSTTLLGGLAGMPDEAFETIEPNPDGVRVVNNVVKNNGAAPPTLPIPVPGVDLFWDGSGEDNCWRNNNYGSSYPATLPICPD